MAKHDSAQFVAWISENTVSIHRITTITGHSVSHSEYGCANFVMVALTAGLRPIHVDKQHVKDKGSVVMGRADWSGVKILLLLLEP